MQTNNTNNSHRSQRSGILSTNTTSRGVEQSVFNGQMLENREQREDVNIDYRRNTYTEPVNHDSMQDKSLQDLRRSDKKSGNSGESEASIKRVLPDDGIFTNLVKDSVMAHVREGIRPMFVNNYYVGDNSWKPGATEGNTKTTQEVDTSTNRSNMAVQTAISSLGEDCKSESYMQTGISRVKAMGNNDGMYNKQSPLVVEPGKTQTSTGCSTNSYSLLDLQLNTPTQQQRYKGLPDLTVPPPVVQPPAMAQPPVVPPQHNETQTGSQKLEENLMRVIETMEQQIRLNITKSDYNMTQNTKMMDQLIKAQDRRDLDPALMDIPTFLGDQPEKCLEWVTRIKNVCRQSGRSFQQELTNKSGLVVQNFLATMDKDISDGELVEKVLQMFSDIPTTTQAIAKLRHFDREKMKAF